MPALLTSTSMPPCSATTSATSAAHDSGSPTSRRRTSPAPSPATSAPTTVAPSSANRAVVAAPMPLLAPVTIATLPLRRIRSPLRDRDLGQLAGVVARVVGLLVADREAQAAHVLATGRPDRVPRVARDVDEVADLQQPGLVLDLHDRRAFEDEVELVRVVEVRLRLRAVLD